MNTTIIDALSTIPTLNPENICKAFQKIFYDIDKMGSGDIIAAKQALDLMVKVSDKLNEQQQIIITDIIKAMQVRAAGHTLYNSCSQKARYKLVENIFYIVKECPQNFHYDQKRKEFVCS